MRDREMATEGLGRPEEEFGVGVGVARCPVNKLELGGRNKINPM